MLIYNCVTAPNSVIFCHSFLNAFQAISMAPRPRPTSGVFSRRPSVSCKEVRIGPCGSGFTVQPQFSQCFPSNFHGSRHAAHPQPGEARASPAQHALYLLGRQGRPNKIVHFLLMLTARVLRMQRHLLICNIDSGVDRTSTSTMKSNGEWATSADATAKY